MSSPAESGSAPAMTARLSSRLSLWTKLVYGPGRCLRLHRGGARAIKRHQLGPVGERNLARQARWGPAAATQVVIVSRSAIAALWRGGGARASQTGRLWPSAVQLLGSALDLVHTLAEHLPRLFQVHL